MELKMWSESTLEGLRNELDVLDRQLMEVLGQRFDVCRRVARHKQANGVSMMQPDRVRLVKRQASELGEALGVDPAFTERLYTLIIGEACRIEDLIMDHGES